MAKGHLTLGERERIRTLHVQKKSLDFIAKALSRAKSTIHSEIKNHLHHGSYEPERADSRARVMRKKPRRTLKMMVPEIESFVKRGLEQGWSPEQIVGRMRLLYPRASDMRISHQTIYAWLYDDKKSGGTWYKHLRLNNRRRHRARTGGRPRVSIAHRKGIELRPKSVEQRRFFGDWEGDTVEGKVNRGRVATLVERKTLFTVMAKVENRGAESFNASVLARLEESPWLPMRTLTVDNGSEFARHEELTEKLGVDVYFARPHCSWQRGLNENTNGIIRQYLPKGTDLRMVDKESIAQVECLLNNRPRKKLGYRTPFEVMAKQFRHTPNRSD